MTVLRADDASIAEAARRLAAGQLVVFPTETVYGLGADASNESAVAAIYALKGRPPDHPLIVHVADLAHARHWATLEGDALALARAFWPGPLTLILPLRAGAPAWSCGGQSTIGLRCPDHPVAQALLQSFARLGGQGVAAPSANRFGRVSPTTAWHVVDDLGDDAPLVLDGGPCRVGLESTIVDLSRGVPAVLRPGGVPLQAIEQVLGHEVSTAAPAHARRDGDARPRPGGDARARASGDAPARPAGDAPRASGTLAAHYAPLTPTELVAAHALASRIDAHAAAGRSVAVLSRTRPAHPRVVAWQPADADVAAYARALYDRLRTLDKARADRLLVEAPPEGASWDAVRDRLQRAANAHAD